MSRPCPNIGRKCDIFILVQKSSLWYSIKSAWSLECSHIKIEFGPKITDTWATTTKMPVLWPCVYIWATGVRFLPIIKSFSVHILIWHRSLQILPKVSPIDRVFRPTNISKIIIPNNNQLPPKKSTKWVNFLFGLIDSCTKRINLVSLKYIYIWPSNGPTVL